MSIMILSLATFGISATWQFAIIGVTLYTISLSVTMVVCPMVCGKTLLNEERVTGMQLCDTTSGLPRLVAPVVAAFLITKYGGMTAEGIIVPTVAKGTTTIPTQMSSLLFGTIISEQLFFSGRSL